MIPSILSRFLHPAAVRPVSLALAALLASSLASCSTTTEYCAQILSGKVEDADFEDMLDAAVALGEEAEYILEHGEPGEMGTLVMIRTRLSEGMAKADHPLVRAACARALMKTRHPKIAALMVQALDDVSHLVRAQAIRGIGELDHAAASQRLASMLTADESPEVRRECARQLGALRAADQIDALVKAMSDKDQTVRVNAEKSLNELTCRDLGDSAEDWQAWLKAFRGRTSSQGGPAR